jgi:hypothetical protein
MVKRVDKCIEMNGHHFQHLLLIQVSCVIEHVVNLSK